MSQVFIGNPTLQHREFRYTIPGVKTGRVVPIRAGGQEKLPDDLKGNNLKNVLEQLHRLGAVEVTEIGKIALPKQLVYRVDPSPIAADEIAEGLQRDEAARQEVASQMMHDAGLAAFQNAGKGVIETSVEVTESTDAGTIKGSVDHEVIVTTKPDRRAGKLRVEKKN